MKAITINLILTFISSFSFAGFNMNGNARTYLQMSQDSVANFSAARITNNSTSYCSNARIGAILPSKSYIVKLQDQQANLLMIPLDNQLLEQEGNIEKRKLTYLASRNGQLVVETATLTIDNRWKHENNLDIQWTTSAGTTVKVSRFIPIDSDAVYGDVKEVSEYGIRCDVHKALQGSEVAQEILQKDVEKPVEEEKQEENNLSLQEETSVEQDVEEIITGEPTSSY